MFKMFDYLLLCIIISETNLGKYLKRIYTYGFTFYQIHIL